MASLEGGRGQDVEPFLLHERVGAVQSARTHLQLLLEALLLEIPGVFSLGHSCCATSEVYLIIITIY